MKTVSTTVSTLLILCTLLFVHCSPDIPYVSTTKEVITQGTWAVDYYYNGQEKTMQYENYVFTFAPTGNVTCTHGIDTYEGTWNTYKDVNRNDVLTINLSNQQPYLSELNDSWNVTTLNLTYVAMKNSVSTQLIFKKL